MYFKSLELFGFKSFAEKTRLDFEPGVTAIVGPNGCGKSNIADSIKWVLGEQSPKAMRGSRMEDVIFNGTDTKEPVGYAEVSLTLSNKDRILPIEYDEVTVTRRLYRSGESEYLLNKTPVRLRDIAELFMGTGIGTSAYSIIEQGKIDQILSSRPEERREVFEEASGITKYKTKKKEALRKLEETENNLVRINDIISEVKRQIGSIERQAKKAERYKERYEFLKGEELKFSRIELETLKEKISASDIDIDGLRKRENEINLEIGTLRDVISGLNRKKAASESMHIDLRSGIFQIDSEISKANDRMAIDRERITELSRRIQNLEEEIGKISENVTSQEREAMLLQEKIDALEKEDRKGIEELSKKEVRFEEVSRLISTYEATISTSKANILDIAAQQAKLKNSITKVSTTLSNHETRLRRLEVEQGQVLAEMNELTLRLKEAESSFESIRIDLETVMHQKDELLGKIAGIDQRLNSLEEESKGLLTSLAANKSRLEILQEATRQYEGFPQAVKALLGKGEKYIEGMRDCLAHIIDVKKGFEMAIQTALGGYLESIVADDREAIDKAILYLRENACGKASFIHKEAFDSSRIKEGYAGLSDSRILGKAIDFVNTDDIYKDMLSKLLMNIFIVKELKDGEALLREYPHLDDRVTFVTLSGEMVRKGFIYAGGDINEDIGLINRQARLYELTHIIHKLERDFHNLEIEKNSRDSEKKGLEERLRDVTEIVNEKEKLFTTSKNTITNLEENIKAVSDEVSVIKLEIDELHTEITTLKQEEGSLVKRLSDAENEARINEERLYEAEQLIGDFTKERESLLIEITEQKTELGSLESKKEGMANTLHILRSSINDAKNNISSRRTEIDASLQKVQELKEEIATLEQMTSKISQERLEKATELSDMENLLEGIIKEINLHESNLKRLEKELEETRARLHALELKKTEISLTIDSLKQRMLDIYKIDLEEIVLPKDWKDIDMDILRKKIEEIRRDLDNMGPVNLVAIEEHKELQDRFVFLINQRDDLLKAKDSLLKAISKINKTTKEMFIKTFNAIQIEFKNFFKMLFGGGDSELILMDESNVLECGIEIAARPPGKRLQNISLLSGGEKSLTAIALIFAIFKVKPSPFCILDEIDAALDEANIDRFSHTLDMFIHSSQFIIITHNKKTIDKADVMYGITMQESGVSKVISVKFSDVKREEVVGQK